jgi:uncharacterized coiled-coil DUF342 family protein
VKTALPRRLAVRQNLTNEITEYKKALETLSAKLKESYAGITRQNESITNLIAERDDLVRKYNDSAKDRNEVVAKYNELAEQVKKLQGGGVK